MPINLDTSQRWPDPTALDCAICQEAQRISHQRAVAAPAPGEARRELTAAATHVDAIQNAFWTIAQVIPLSLTDPVHESLAKLRIEIERCATEVRRVSRRGRPLDDRRLLDFVSDVKRARSCSRAQAYHHVAECIVDVWTAEESHNAWRKYLEAAPCSQFDPSQRPLLITRDGAYRVTAAAYRQECARRHAQSSPELATDSDFRAVWRQDRRALTYDRPRDTREVRVHAVIERLQSLGKRRGRK